MRITVVEILSIFGVLFSLAMLSILGYIAWHFISKFW